MFLKFESNFYWYVFPPNFWVIFDQFRKFSSIIYQDTWNIKNVSGTFFEKFRKLGYRNFWNHSLICK